MAGKSLTEEQSLSKQFYCRHFSSMRAQSPEDAASIETLCIPADLHGN